RFPMFLAIDDATNSGSSIGLRPLFLCMSFSATGRPAFLCRRRRPCIDSLPMPSDHAADLDGSWEMPVGCPLPDGPLAYAQQASYIPRRDHHGGRRLRSCCHRRHCVSPIASGRVTWPDACVYIPSQGCPASRFCMANCSNVSRACSAWVTSRLSPSRISWTFSGTASSCPLLLRPEARDLQNSAAHCCPVRPTFRGGGGSSRPLTARSTDSETQFASSSSLVIICPRVGRGRVVGH